MRHVMMLGLVVLGSGCVWRGETKFVAKSTMLPPAQGTTTSVWTVDLDEKQLIAGGETKTLSDAQVSGLKASLASLAPASKEECVMDGLERTIETSGGQVHYLEGTKSCGLEAPGTYFYVESFEKVFAQLAGLTP